MRFGFMLLPRDVDETRDVARVGDAAGFDWMGVADSPTVYQESYLHQLEAARVSERIRIGPMVTHLVARHPVIVGNLLATFNEFTGGRGMAAVGTGNSAARGLGLKPATMAELEDGVEALESYWRGEGAAFSSTTYPRSHIPGTGFARRRPELLVAADGPRGTALAARIGDGLLYGGTLDPEVLTRRLQVVRATDATRSVWLAPSASVCATKDEVRDDLGAMIVAMANRAFRGDLSDRNLPPEIERDVHEMWRRYDYAFHADNTRPANLDVVTPALSDHLIDHMCVWGDEDRWRARLDLLESQGCDGVMFIMGQADQAAALRGIAERLVALGRLPTSATA
ncbi:LLM class flavin-dependent oxidoreductase [Pseudonocardia sp.]|uniref:LLM class flavin-dependent oxidoreductase n=1 Tax=Pseudonocardia sp. TaxID=60912 RepID=UPI003D0FC9FA